MRSTNIWQTLGHLVADLATLAGQLSLFILSWSLLLIWTAWWLGAVNWARLGDALRRGAWAPFVLLLVVAALVWSRLDPTPGRFLGIPLPNFWWQLGNVILLALYTLFLGWLQGILHWAPRELNLEPPAHGHDPHHGHGHHHGHADHGPDHAAEVTEPTHVQDDEGSPPH